MLTFLCGFFIIVSVGFVYICVQAKKRFTEIMYENRYDRTSSAVYARL